jgi:phage tail-like protein
MSDPANRKDPLGVFLFGMKITGAGQPAPAGIGASAKTDAVPQMDSSAGTAFFKTISGLGFSADAQDVVEGGITTFTRKVIQPRKWNNIKLAQGFTGDMTLWNWRMNPSRVNLTIYALGPDMQTICSWDVINAYPIKWDGPELDASKSELAIETIEIVHEGLTMRQGA